ncbi:MAG: histidine phosphatase family protein [Desulfatiglans sp.]|jgi:alpha-ribazole phosphatase/probable phosphoglycerate mutase|nr:histidine phosphatase family protein [Thermodesulfobacteriota bacterium]MEE4352437.1 histidine phosphatase family protein [Desulfatiglans sp.]
MKRINRLYLIRHGQIKGFEDYYVYGHTDVALTRIGLFQMERMAERLRLLDLAVIFSSDLQRAETGARLVAQNHDVPCHALADLREMYFGEWEGLTLGEIRNRFPEELNKRAEDLLNYQIPGKGETIKGFAERITSCFEKILNENEGKDIVLVAHGGVNRILLCRALGLDLERMFSIHQDYGCLNIVDYFPDSAVVKLING